MQHSVRRVASAEYVLHVKSRTLCNVKFGLFSTASVFMAFPSRRVTKTESAKREIGLIAQAHSRFSKDAQRQNRLLNIDTNAAQATAQMISQKVLA